jgi:hypothetical protein
VEPGRELGFTAKASEPAIGAHERLLRDVLRRSRVAAEQPPRDPQRAIAVIGHECVEALLQVRCHLDSCRREGCEGSRSEAARHVLRNQCVRSSGRLARCGGREPLRALVLREQRTDLDQRVEELLVLLGPQRAELVDLRVELLRIGRTGLEHRAQLLVRGARLLAQSPLFAARCIEDRERLRPRVGGEIEPVDAALELLEPGRASVPAASAVLALASPASRRDGRERPDRKCGDPERRLLPGIHRDSSVFRAQPD